jgi:hypothetical protein
MVQPKLTAAILGKQKFDKEIVCGFCFIIYPAAMLLISGRKQNSRFSL